MRSTPPRRTPQQPHKFLVWLIAVGLVFAFLFTQDDAYRQAETQVQRYCIYVKMGRWPDYLNKFDQWCKEK